jgi:uncharacterized protein YabN with tetrapyrrole methylase and pyrophosphatase domain
VERKLQLQEYEKESGHTNVPQSIDRIISSLVFGLKNRGKLKKLGFQWNAHDDAWSAMFKELQEYENEQCHANAPRKYKQNNLKLGIWVENQRQRY